MRWCLNTSGSGPQTWDDLEAAGELEGLEWEYIARDDACDVGRALNGRRLANLAVVYELLPNFNGNPRCERGSACACTALPVRAEG